MPKLYWKATRGVVVTTFDDGEIVRTVVDPNKNTPPSVANATRRLFLAAAFFLWVVRSRLLTVSA
jgi:hypothetical protein